MIKGRITQAGSPIIKVNLIGTKSQAMIEGILDTGFDGYLCLPLTIAVPLGLELIDAADSELADGTIVEDEPVFAGNVEWNGEIMDVEILLTKSSKVLIGTSLLKGTEVQLNFSTSEVFIKGIVNAGR